MNKKTYKIITLGCKVNSYESQGIKEYLDSLGYKEDEDPEYIIVNTCAVTNTAEKKCLTKVRSFSEHNPESRIAVLGCSSSLNPKSYIDINNVYVVAGNEGKLEAIKTLLKNKEKVVLSKLNNRHERFEDEIKISNFGKECRAFLKIQDGCDNFCTYCIIPKTRGNSRSRKHEDVLQEAKRLFNSGYKEIVVTGIDMGDYKDPENSNYTLDELIEDIIKITPSGSRIRISSLETSQLSSKLINLYIDHQDKLASHIHIPLQSGSDTIIKVMHRKYDLKEFEEKVNYLRKYIPYLGLSTDVIVGFPGETEELFLETYNFITKLKFMRLHVFPYSPRPGTLAATLKDQVSSEEKKDRVHRLIDLGITLQKEFEEQCEGKMFAFLPETVIKKNGKMYFQGYLDNYLEVEVESDKDILNQIVPITIKNSLYVLC